MFGSHRAVFGITVGTLLIGYCIYFDYKRRKDPDYKKKVHKRRSCRRNMKSEANEGVGPLNSSDLERYFIQELRLSETLFANGNFESGVEHLANAIAASSQPFQILHLFQSMLPSFIFEMLLRKIQSQASMNNGVMSPTAGSAKENITG